MAGNNPINENDVNEILNSLVTGVITINAKGIILSFNKTAENIFGYNKQEILGKNVSQLMPEPDKSKHDNYIKRYLESNEAHIIGIGRKVIAQRKNGETFPLHLLLSEYPTNNNSDRWFIGSCLDITLQEQQENQLRRAQKMDALGKLTSGISHDFNNLLNIILGYSELLSKKLNGQSKLQEYVSHIKHAAERGSSLTSKLLYFSQTKPEQKVAVSVNNLLESNFQMLSEILHPLIQLNMQLDKDLWPVFINKGRFEDAILNMSINSMHAMPDGGTLKFTTSNTQISNIDGQVLNLKKGEYIKLTISDTGTGMSNDVISHIFEPFFTTKDDKGTGLGLSQVYSFVNKSGGTIRVYSEPGQGTSFSIYLPRYYSIDENENVDSVIDLMEDSSLNTANILIVDDEESIRKLNSDILTSQGYTVFTAANAQQALSILDTEKIDLIICDVIMPETDGYKLAEQVNNKYPDIKIQLCSGFPEHKGKLSTSGPLRDNMLLKPITSNQLINRVAQLLVQK